MPTPTTPVPPEIQALIDALGHLSITVSVDIPVADALFNLIKAYRETMAPEVRDAYDRMQLDWNQRVYAVLVKAWDALQLPPPLLIPKSGG